MKKRFAFMTALLMLSTLTNFSVYANETTTTGAYIPSDIPVETVENTTVVADNIEELEEICKKLHTILDEPTVYVAKRDGCVVFGSEKQADIDSAKAYCKENGIDLDLVCFILICEETSSYEETTPPYIPEDVKTEETTTVTTFEQPDKIAELEGICQKLHTILDAPTVYVAKRDGCVVFGSENQADIDSAKAYCEENGIDLNLVCFILIREETPSYEETTPPYIPEGVETEPTTATTATTTRKKVDPAKVKQLNAIYEQLKQFECLNNIIFYNAGYNDTIDFVSYNNNTEVINKVNQYIADNGIDESLVSVAVAVEEDFAETAVRGDISGDGKADISDAVMLQKYLTRKVDSISASADLNNDGIVDVFDYIIIKHMLLS